MLLLYRSYLYKHSGRVFHLHSIMLLLYPESSCQAVFCGIFTFHYASTVSEVGLCTNIQREYLHSIMLLLYLTIHNSACKRIFIYIPLCFYCIPTGRDGLTIFSYLHSIMLLLYQGVEWLQGGSLFHLHSIMLLLYLI